MTQAALQDLTTPAAGLRILIRVHQTIQTIHKELEVLVLIRGRHLSHRHHTDAMTLTTRTENFHLDRLKSNNNKVSP